MSGLIAECTVPWAAHIAEIERAVEVPRTTIEDVRRLLAAIQPILQDMGTPAAYFNLLYTDITARVGQMYDAGEFLNPRYLVELDVQFAERYIHALMGWLRGDGSALSSWLLVFEPEADERSASLTAALGVNAHINADLAFALLATHRVMGLPLHRHSREHQDYLAINQIFHEAIPSLRRTLSDLPRIQSQDHCHHPHGAIHRHCHHPLGSLLCTVSELGDEIENWFADLVIDETRDQAWEVARHLWRRRDDPAYVRRHEEALDYVTCALGMALDSAPCRAVLSD